MAFKRSTVRSRPSPPKLKQRSDFLFLCFFVYLILNGSEPTVRLVRFALAEHEGHIIGDLRSKCKGLAPLIPSVSTKIKAEKRFFVSLLFCLSDFKRDRTDSPSRAPPRNPLINKALSFMSTGFLFILNRISNTFLTNTASISHYLLKVL